MPREMPAPAGSGALPSLSHEGALIDSEGARAKQLAKRTQRRLARQVDALAVQLWATPRTGARAARPSGAPLPPA